MRASKEAWERDQCREGIGGEGSSGRDGREPVPARGRSEGTAAAMTGRVGTTAAAAQVSTVIPAIAQRGRQPGQRLRRLDGGSDGGDGRDGELAGSAGEKVRCGRHRRSSPAPVGTAVAAAARTRCTLLWETMCAAGGCWVRCGCWVGNSAADRVLGGTDWWAVLILVRASGLG